MKRDHVNLGRPGQARLSLLPPKQPAHRVITSLVAFSLVAAVNQAFADCNSDASSCLGGCADIYQPAPNDGPYNRCVVNCNQARNACRDRELFDKRR